MYDLKTKNQVCEKILKHFKNVLITEFISIEKETIFLRDN